MSIKNTNTKNLPSTNKSKSIFNFSSIFACYTPNSLQINFSILKCFRVKSIFSRLQTKSIALIVKKIVFTQISIFKIKLLQNAQKYIPKLKPKSEPKSQNLFYTRSKNFGWKF